MNLVDRIIARAARTPYFDLDGYMLRDWLLPPRRFIERDVWHKIETLHSVTERLTIEHDGTGPVDWRKRPISWLLQWTMCCARVHHILRSDLEDCGHDHPWPYVTIILRNSYIEHRYDEHGFLIGSKVHGPGSILFRRARSVHKLELIGDGPVVTLFIAGPKVQSWFFVPPGGKRIPWREYIRK